MAHADWEHKMFYASDEQRWREVKRLATELAMCACEEEDGSKSELSPCVKCWSRIYDIEDLADMVLKGIDGPSR
jgi:hypothetical protein